MTNLAATSAQRPPPPEQQPSVTISPLPTTVTAGVEIRVTVQADRGVHWTWIPGDQSYEDSPKVTYTDTYMSIPNVEEMRDHTGGGGTYRVTFLRPGNYTISAHCVTTTGSSVTATPVNVTVHAAGPPAFTLLAPADGAPVDLGPTGGQVNVRLTAGAEQYYPLKVAVTRDGSTTTSDYNGGGEFATSVSLAATPLGTRNITVTCTDPDGKTTTLTRGVVGRDASPPTVAINPFTTDVTVTTVPYRLTLTGTTPGTASGVTGVQYAVTGGPSGPATSTGTGFATWRADIDLPTTGTFALAVTATNSRGGTNTATASVTLHF